MRKTKIDYSARTHVGCVRGNNEDNLYTDGVSLPLGARELPFSIDGCVAVPAIFAVCDGMGGEDDGEVASQIVVQALAAIELLLKSSAVTDLPHIVQATVERANTEIRELGGTEKRIGTTLALVVARSNGVHCASIGDSRIYCLRRGTFWQVTRDHTLAAERQNQDVHMKSAHMLTRCIGIGSAATVAHYAQIRGACRLLICSDGLTDMVESTAIEYVLRTTPRASAAADRLISAALSNGGRDNITVIVLDIGPPKLSLQGLIKQKKRKEK